MLLMIRVTSADLVIESCEARFLEHDQSQLHFNLSLTILTHHTIFVIAQLGWRQNASHILLSRLTFLQLSARGPKHLDLTSSRDLSFDKELLPLSS